jgi:hypothetical protein
LGLASGSLGLEPFLVLDFFFFFFFLCKAEVGVVDVDAASPPPVDAEAGWLAGNAKPAVSSPARKTRRAMGTPGGGSRGRVQGERVQQVWRGHPSSLARSR